MKISILRQTQEGNGTNLVDFGAVEVRSSFNPTNDATLVNKAYVDSVAAGLDAKESVRAATTAEVDLTTGGELVIDGVSLADGDRVLVKSQTDQTENGIYVCHTGAWTRAEDQDGNPASEVSSGNFTFVEEGTQNGSTGWVLTGDGLITIGTDNLVWTQFSQAAEYLAGDGMSLTGNTFSVDVDDLLGFGIENDGSNNLRVASSMAGNGLNGGSGSAFSIEANTTGGANLARAIDVSINGVAIKIDDATIGENGSGQLEVKDDAIIPSKLDTTTEVAAGTDGYVLSWDQTAGKMDWVPVSNLIVPNGAEREELTYGASNDIVAGTPFGLAQEVKSNTKILVFWNGILLKDSEYSLNVSGDPDTLTLNATADNDFADGDTIVVYYSYVS